MSTPGGSQRVLAGLVRHLPAHGLDVRATLFEHGPLEGWLAAAGCPTEVVEAGGTRRPWRVAPAVLGLAARAREADVVLSNQAKGHVYGGLAAARARVPAVWWQHEAPVRRRTELAAARVPSRAIVCCTPDIAAAQRRVGPRRRHVVVVPAGIAVGDVQARAGSGAPIRARLGGGDDPIVGMVGRLVAWKGHDVFLRAAALVAERIPRARFVVVGGPGREREDGRATSLHRLSHDLGVGERTFFAGHQDDPYPWFDACDVVVNASDDEPFGLVVLEAMALGKPVVATAAGGPRRIVQHDRSGLLVPPRAPVEMAQAIERILTDPMVASRLGAGARQRVNDFEEEAMAERFAGLLREVAVPRRHRAPSTRSAPGTTSPASARDRPGLRG
jgi:glycosyltransferase involved in cell wall biosynthesis